MGNPRLSAPPWPGGLPLNPGPQRVLGARGTRIPADVVTTTQVHGRAVLSVNGSPPTASACEGDALITDQPGTCVGVRTADCVPILLWAPGTTVVAAVHANGVVQVARGDTVIQSGDHVIVVTLLDAVHEIIRLFSKG